jgi:hypothetical protein
LTLVWARPVFFPEQAYVQVKAVNSPAADYQIRLVTHFDLDVAAAHPLVGVTRSFGIASLISWRGYWYVVHLGAVEPPAGQGVVDAPAVGNGVFTLTGGGC